VSISLFFHWRCGWFLKKAIKLIPRGGGLGDPRRDPGGAAGGSRRGGGGPTHPDRDPRACGPYSAIAGDMSGACETEQNPPSGDPNWGAVQRRFLDLVKPRAEKKPAMAPFNGVIRGVDGLFLAALPPRRTYRRGGPSQTPAKKRGHPFI